MEYLEYYDKENKHKLGEAERDEIHKNNLWHREVSVWVLNDKNEILVQRRSPNKKQNPNKYAVCAGHIDIGERPEEAAVRELFEETGIKVNENELNFIDMYVNEQEENNCFKYTYYIQTSKKISEMVMQVEEVSELKFITMDELEDVIRTQDEDWTFSKKFYAKLIVDKLKEVIKNR